MLLAGHEKGLSACKNKTVIAIAEAILGVPREPLVSPVKQLYVM